MKKLLTVFILFTCILTLSGCGKRNTYKVSITVPAGSTKAFCFSDTEISATGKKITILSNQELGDTEVILEPVNEFITPGYVATYLTPGMAVTFDATKGEWFKIGVSVQNDTDTDKIVYVEVKGVEVRIA